MAKKGQAFHTYTEELKRKVARDCKLERKSCLKYAVSFVSDLVSKEIDSSNSELGKESPK